MSVTTGACMARGRPCAVARIIAAKEIYSQPENIWA